MMTTQKTSLQMKAWLFLKEPSLIRQAHAYLELVWGIWYYQPRLKWMMDVTVPEYPADSAGKDWLSVNREILDVKRSCHKEVGAEKSKECLKYFLLYRCTDKNQFLPGIPYLQHYDFTLCAAFPIPIWGGSFAKIPFFFKLTDTHVLVTKLSISLTSIACTIYIKFTRTPLHWFQQRRQRMVFQNDPRLLGARHQWHRCAELHHFQKLWKKP